jgi:hypothetical protein
MEVLQREGVYDLIGPERIHDNIAEAVEAYLKENEKEKENN